ncbi:MAG: rhodanese-like domain-containing protein [Pirellulaceae bacterium]
MGPRPDAVSTVDRITAKALDEQLQVVHSPMILDVRTEKEWDAGHVEGSVNIPLNRLADRLNEVPTYETVVVHCQAGYRSSIAVSLLQANGHANVMDMVGGYAAWKASQLPVVEPVA